MQYRARGTARAGRSPAGRAVATGTLSVALAILAACGGGSGGRPASPAAVEHTAVTLLVSSTANDRLATFRATFASITLTSQSGMTVTLLGIPSAAEFMHLNGSAEPLVTTSVPSDTYVSATATLNDANFTCVTIDPTGSLHTATFDQGGAAPAGFVTVNLPNPISVLGAHQILDLDLDAAASVKFASCADAAANNSYSIRPTFRLAPYALSAKPGNGSNGLLANMEGLITGISPTSGALAVTLTDGVKVSVATGAGTGLDYITGLGDLVTGLPVDLDAALQPDGTLLATRIAAGDPSTAAVTLWRGTLTSLYLGSASPTQFDVAVNGVEGALFPSGQSTAGWTLGLTGTAYRISPQAPGLASLPFTPRFDEASAVPGQGVYATSHSATFPDAPGLVLASALTLVPQTLNGYVNGIDAAGAYTAYTVTLAPYDLYALLAPPATGGTGGPEPASFVAYVGARTQTATSAPIALGDTLRFNGLVFNDNGRLRMATIVVLDGVAF